MRRWIALLLLCAAGTAALGAELPRVDIPAANEARRHGAETAVGVCLGCHTIKFLKYDDLAQLGFSDQALQSLRQDKGGKDALKTELTPETLRAAFGKVPPDLSLMAQAREGGPRYIYGLLTGFYQKPDGSVDNLVFPGVKMPDVLGLSNIEDPAQRAPLEAQAKEVAAFLVWAADPHVSDRHHIGYVVLAYVAVLAVLLYLTKRRIWSRLD